MDELISRAYECRASVDVAPLRSTHTAADPTPARRYGLPLLGTA